MAHTKLGREEISNLRQMLADGVPRQEVAEAFGVSASAVTYHAINAGLGRADLAAEADAPAGPSRLFEAPEWFDRALCAQTDPESFFPEKGGSTREAKSVCRRCTVAAECLDYALDNLERFGIWGGLSERERRRLTKQINLDQQEPA